LRVLVSGGAGFVGSHVVNELVHQGHQPIVLDNLSTGKLQNIQQHLENKAATLIEGDIRDPSISRTAMAQAEAAIHLAAIVDHETCLLHPAKAIQVNGEGTRIMLEAARENHVKRFVYASSAAIYGATAALPIDEDVIPAPLSPYGSSKLTGEGHCLNYRDRYGLDVVCLRYFNIFGPRQISRQYSGVITQFIARLKESQPPLINGDGEQTRDFVSIQDVVKATLSALDSQNASGVYNIATGEETSINQLAQLLIEISGQKHIQPTYGPPREGEIMRSVANIRKARTELGFVPETDLPRDLSQLWAWQVQ
jgi:nucleoside-diphosphate-sugar epimerase